MSPAARVATGAFVAASALLFAVPGGTEPTRWCDGVPSTYDERVCLDREYRGADALLRQKVRQLIETVRTRKFDGGAVGEAHRKEVLAAIPRAAALWRQQLQAECGVLAEASTGTGNGGDLEAMNCRIAATYARIKFLSTSPAYAWLWD